MGSSTTANFVFDNNANRKLYYRDSGGSYHSLSDNEILYEIENMSYKEIAEIMHCSSGTVMSRLFYARRQLRKTLNHSLPLDTVK